MEIRPAVCTDVIYGRKADLALTLNVFTPSTPNGAGIIHLASGGWHKAHYDHSSNYDPSVFFEEALRRGYAVFRVVHGGEPAFAPDEMLVDTQVSCTASHARVVESF